MADVSIDSIQLQIESDSSGAEKSVERLATSLMGLNRSLIKVGNNAGAVRSLARSLAALNDIKTPNLEGLISQLKELSSINPDKLTKSVKVNVNANGLDKLDDIKLRLERAFSGLKDLKLGQTGVTGLLTSIRQIANVDLKKFDSSSFNGIIDGLRKFSSLKDADLKGTGVTNIASAISRLAKADIPKAASGLEGVKNSFAGFSGLDMKATGIASLSSAIVKLTQTDFSKLNADTFKPFIESLKSMSQLQGFSESTKGIVQFVNALMRLLKATENMPDVDQRLSALSTTLGNFYTSLSNMPEIGESTLRAAEAMTQLSKRGGSATINLTKYNNITRETASISKVIDLAFDSTKKAFSDLLAVYKKLGSASFNGLKKLLSIAKDLGSKGVEGIKKFTDKLKGLNSVGQSFGGFAGKLKEVLGLLVGIRGITGVFNWVKDATEAGANVAETNHIIEETFGDLSKQASDWANEAIEKYGIARTSALRYAGTLSAMFQSSGIGYKDAAEMSQQLVGMAGDLSSFYNVDTATVFQKLKSGMAGMVRPLRDFGIDLSVASLNEFALAQGMGKTYAKMTQAEKTMLRYQYLLQATSNQQGDFQKTNTSMANSLRTLKAYLEAITETFGEGFVSTLRHVVRWLNSVAKRVLSVAQVFRDFMEVLFGKNISGGITINDYEEMDDFATDTADATGATSDNLGDAADNAKELKKELSVLPFDELNQLAKPKEESETKSPSGSSGGIGDSGLGGFGQGLLDQMSEAFDGNGLPDAVNRWAERIKKAFLDKDWKGLGMALADGVNVGIQKLYDLLNPDKLHAKVDPWVDAFIETFNSLIDNIHFDQLGSAMANGLNFLLEEANRILTKTDWENLGGKLAEWANSLIHDIKWDELGKFFANKLNVFWKTAKGFVEKFKWGQLGKDLATGADAFVKQIDYDSMIATLTGGLKGISKTVKSFAANFPWKENGVLLASKINDFIGKLPTEEVGEAIGELVNGITDGFLAIFDTRKGGVNFEELGNKLAAGVNKMIAVIKPSNVANTIEVIFKGAWGLFKGFILKLDTKTATTNLLEVFRKLIKDMKPKELGEDLADFVQKIADDIKTFFGASDVWTGLGTKIAEGINSFMTNFNGKDLADGLNAIIGAFNDMFGSAINGLDKEQLKNNIDMFLRNLDWDGLFKALAPFVAARLAGGIALMGVDGIKTTLAAKLRTAIGGAFGDTTITNLVTNSSKGIFGGFIKAIGDAATPGTLIFAAVAAGAEIQKLGELMSGGNGILTEKGGAIDSFLEKMQELYGKAGETREEIFKLKEEWEVGKMTDSDFFSQVAEVLKNSGVNADQAKEAVERLKGQLNLTEEQTKALDAVVESLGDTSGEAAKKLDELGLDRETVIKNVTEAIGNAANKLSELGEYTLPAVRTEAQTAFADMIRNGTSFEQALGTIIDNFDLTEDEVNALKTAIDEQLGQPGLFDALMNSLDTTGIKSENLKEIINTVKQYFQGLDSTTLTNIQTNLGTSAAQAEKLAGKAGTAKTNMDELDASAQSAADSSEEYNKSSEKTPGLIDLIKAAVSKIGNSLISKIYESKEDIDTRVNTWGDDQVTAIGNQEEKLSSKADEAGDCVTDGYADSLNSQENLDKVADANTNMVDVGFEAFWDACENGSPSKRYQEAAAFIPDGVVLGIKDGTSKVVEAIKKLANDMHYAFKDTATKERFKEATQPIIEGIQNALQDGKNQTEQDVRELGNSLVENLKDILSDEQSSMEQSVRDFVNDGIIQPLGDAIRNGDVSTDVRNMMDSIISAITSREWDMYYAGQDIATDFKNGLKSVNLPTLQVNWTKVTYGDDNIGKWWVEMPDFSWYAKGGLFTNPALIGIGEKGNEAVLPLENRKTMGMIADAILKNSNGVGINGSDVTSAMVQAMMANQGNQPQINLYAELKTEDNETLARAVMRGIEQIDYRNNATPKYSY